MGLSEITFASFVDVKSAFHCIRSVQRCKVTLHKSLMLTIRRIRRLSTCSIMQYLNMNAFGLYATVISY
jgi:hypothetical protein